MSLLTLAEAAGRLRVSIRTLMGRKYVPTKDTDAALAAIRALEETK